MDKLDKVLIGLVAALGGTLIMNQAVYKLLEHLIYIEKGGNFYDYYHG